MMTTMMGKARNTYICGRGSGATHNDDDDDDEDNLDDEGDEDTLPFPFSRQWLYSQCPSLQGSKPSTNNSSSQVKHFKMIIKIIMIII